MIICTNSSQFLFSHYPRQTLFFSLSFHHELLRINYLATANMSETKPDQDSTPASTTSPAQAEETPKDTAPPASSYTEMASNAAGTATTAAAGVKDSVFSMFGGGAKKEKKEEPEGETEDRSGSSKAKKDAEAAEAEGGGEVRVVLSLPCSELPILSRTRTELIVGFFWRVGRRS